MRVGKVDLLLNLAYPGRDEPPFAIGGATSGNRLQCPVVYVTVGE